MNEREKLEALGAHLDNIQTATRAAKNEFSKIAKEGLWDTAEDAEEALEKLTDIVQNRLDELDDELCELDAEENGSKD